MDEDGDPFENGLLQIGQIQYIEGRRTLSVGGYAASGDSGEFKLLRIVPGRYFLRVSERIRWAQDERAPVRNVKPGEKDMQPYDTYYPGLRDLTGATPIEIRPGQDIKLGDVKLLNAPLVHVRGKVVGDLTQLTGARVVRLRRETAGSAWTLGADIAKDGSFDLANMPTGEFTIAVAGQQPERGEVVYGWTPVLIGENGIEGAVIHAGAAPLSGVVRFESGSQPTPRQMWVRLSEAAGPSPIAVARGLIGTDGSFQIPTVAPGSYFADVIGLPSGMYLKNVEINGQQATDKGFSWTGGDASLQILIGAKAATVTGVVQDSEGRPVAGATVTLVPNTPMPGRPRYYPSVTADQQGRYQITNTPPGQYRVYAWESLTGSAHWDPDFTRLFDSRSERFSLAEGEISTLSPKIITTSYMQETLQKAGRR